MIFQHLLATLAATFLSQLVPLESHHAENDSKVVALIDQLPDSWPLAPGNPAVDISSETQTAVNELSQITIEISTFDSESLLSSYETIRDEIRSGKPSYFIEEKLLLLNKALFDVPDHLTVDSVFSKHLLGTLRNGPFSENAQHERLFESSWPWKISEGSLTYSLERRVLFFQGRYDFAMAFTELKTKFGRRKYNRE